MPQWPEVMSTSAIDRARSLHESAIGVTPALAASAPGNWALIGEHVDHIGGVVVMSMSDLRAAVAATPRNDDTIMVTVHQRDSAGDEDSYSDSVTLEQISELAAEAQQNPASSPVGGIASRLGGLVWTMIHRQLLSRETPGFDVTVVTDIPGDAGLGSHSAIEAAWALALLGEVDPRDDAPIRTRLAEVCAQSAQMFSEVPPLRARYTTSLRGTEGLLSVIDYADGSLTTAPMISHDADVRAFLIYAPGQEFAHLGDDIRRRQAFVDQAAHAYGVDSLRQLPDTGQRVIEWLTAIHSVQGSENVPSLIEARNWMHFYVSETERAQQFVGHARSRRTGEAVRLMGESQEALRNDYGITTDTDNALAELCQQRGAVAARSAMAGLSNAVIAVVPSKKSENFAADLSDDGFVIVRLAPGRQAKLH